MHPGLQGSPLVGSMLAMEYVSALGSGDLVSGQENHVRESESCYFIEVKNGDTEPGETAQWSREHTVLTEDCSPVPSTHSQHLTNACDSSCQGSDAPFLISISKVLMCACVHIVHLHTHTQKEIQSHKNASFCKISDKFRITHQTHESNGLSLKTWSGNKERG